MFHKEQKLQRNVGQASVMKDLIFGFLLDQSAQSLNVLFKGATFRFFPHKCSSRAPPAEAGPSNGPVRPASSCDGRPTPRQTTRKLVGCSVGFKTVSFFFFLLPFF